MLCQYQIYTQLFVSASIGISLYPQDTGDVQELLHNADLAMHQAKESGRHCYRFYTGEFDQRAQEFTRLEKDLRRATDNAELYLDYQPIVSAADGRLAGLEALVRWRHPTQGVLMPDRFIPLAEETGLITALGAQVLDQACTQFLELDAGLPGAGHYLAINVSTPQFRGGFNLALVQDLLVRKRFPAHRLVLEITESLLMEKDDQILQTLAALRELGVRLSVDDFGTGYSSLGYLHQFPVDILKIDKSFIQRLEVDASALSIVKAVLAMAGSLSLTVVSEGVETPGQAQLLRRLGCDMLQGYHLGRPQSPSVLRGRLARAPADLNHDAVCGSACSAQGLVT